MWATYFRRVRVCGAAHRELRACPVATPLTALSSRVTSADYSWISSGGASDGGENAESDAAGKQELIDGLNTDLRGEFQAVIMYRLYASMVQGPYRQELRTFFANEIPEELSTPRSWPTNLGPGRHSRGGAGAGDGSPGREADAGRALKAEVETIDRYIRRRSRPRIPASTVWPRNSTTSSPTRRTTGTSCARCWPAGPERRLSGAPAAARVPGRPNRRGGGARSRRRRAPPRARPAGVPASWTVRMPDGRRAPRNRRTAHGGLRSRARPAGARAGSGHHGGASRLSRRGCPNLPGRTGGGVAGLTGGSSGWDRERHGIARGHEELVGHRPAGLRSGRPRTGVLAAAYEVGGRTRDAASSCRSPDLPARDSRSGPARRS